MPPPLTFLNDVMIAHGEKKTVNVKMVPIAGSGGDTTIVREGTLNSPSQEAVGLDGVNGTSASMVTIEVLGPASVRFRAAANATDPPGPVHYDKETGSITMTLDQFIMLVGGPGMNYLIAQNIGMEPSSYRLTLTNLAPNP